jgi:hypothetical protein
MRIRPDPGLAAGTHATTHRRSHAQILIFAWSPRWPFLVSATKALESDAANASSQKNLTTWHFLYPAVHSRPCRLAPQC